MNNDLQALVNVWDLLDDIPPSMVVGSAYAKSMHSKPLSYYIARIAKLPLGSGKVMDAGCGCGTWSFALRTEFDEVIGLDTSTERIQVAQWLANKGGIAGVTFNVQSITDTRLPDESMDAVFCYSVLISAIPAAVALTEFYRILKPGGRIYVQLNGIGWSYYLRDERGQNEPHCNQMGRDGLYNTICQIRMDEWLELAALRSKSRRPWLSRSKLLFDNIVLKSRNRLIRSVATRIAASLSQYSKSLASQYPADSSLCDIDAINNLCDRIEVTPKYRKTACDVAAFIKKECGDKYVQLFVQDLYGLENGRQQTFSHQWAGRGYSPDEISNILDSVGFEDFQWGTEGMIGNSSDDDDTSCVSIFNDEIAAWEFVARKPEQFSIAGRQA